MSNKVSYYLQYQNLHVETGDLAVRIDMQWDNPIHEDVVAERINSWLLAVGLDLEVVTKKTK